jgi:hypothetical protein
MNEQWAEDRVERISKRLDQYREVIELLDIPELYRKSLYSLCADCASLLFIIREKDSGSNQG